MYYAHTFGKDKALWQPLPEHLRNVGRLAAERGAKFGAARLAALAGQLHDLGKYSDAFQRRLEGVNNKVDHSTAGAKELLELELSGLDWMMAQLTAYCIAGHHAGLPDRNGAGDGTLDARVDRPAQPLGPIWRNEIAFEVNDLVPPKDFRWHSDPKQRPFQLSFLGRMIFSCLVDADRRDTESFGESRGLPKADRGWPKLPDIIDGLIARFDRHMADMAAKAAPSKVNRLRADILAHVRAKAKLPRGVYTLDVPTGGGKTLASLGFALDHAKAHGMERIIAAIPFTSVTDQTADVWRAVLGDDVILEHHSAIEVERPAASGERSVKGKLRLAMEDWAAPVIATTNVQLFESLFSARPARCRKLHNLANAVIVLDEAQTIPLNLLRPCVAALQELVRNYGCTIVLCTATQPALGAPDFPDGFDLGEASELAPDPKALHAALKRVTPKRGGVMSDADVVAALAGQEQALVIVNTRKHALTLYRAVKEAGFPGAVHLSTRQTSTDRRAILAEVRERLKTGQPCRLIATSLVEAGVDLDFPVAWRAEAGLDQITQAAGRVNREGKRPVADSIVTVFRPAEGKPPPEIASLIGDWGRIKDQGDADLLSPAAIRNYFEEVYWRVGEKGLDRVIVKEREGDIPRQVLEAFKVTSAGTDFNYRSIGDAFRLVEDSMSPVIVAHDDKAKYVLERLRHGLPPGAAARELQAYIVQVPPRDRAKLIGNSHVTYVEGFGDQFPVLRTGEFYSRETGLEWEKADELGIKNNMV